MSALLYASALVDAHLGRVQEARDAAERGIALSEQLRRRGLPPPAPQRARLPRAFTRRSGGSRQDPEAACSTTRLVGLARAKHLRGAAERDRGARRAGRARGGAQAPGGVAGPPEPDRESLGRGQCRQVRRADPGRRRRPSGPPLPPSGTPSPSTNGFRSLSTWPAPCSPWAAVQRRTRKRGAARESLERSLAIFDELGATLWAEKARSELVRIGGRTAAGDDLTPTERRIADLVARGKTNKEVAAQLFITPRTVEGHLTRIYAKLGVRSRAELAHRTSVPAE